jgi:hypothetical protein
MADQTTLLNPAVTRFITSIITRLLTMLGGILIAKGWLTSEEVGGITPALIEYIVGGILVLGTAAYGLIRNWTDQQKIVTALATTAPMTEDQLEAKIASGVAASVATPKTTVPKV